MASLLVSIPDRAAGCRDPDLAPRPYIRGLVLHLIQALELSGQPEHAPISQDLGAIRSRAESPSAAAAAAAEPSTEAESPADAAAGPKRSPGSEADAGRAEPSAGADRSKADAAERSIGEPSGGEPSGGRGVDVGRGSAEGIASAYGGAGADISKSEEAAAVVSSPRDQPECQSSGLFVPLTPDPIEGRSARSGAESASLQVGRLLVIKA